MSESQGVNSVEVAVSILDVIAGFNAPVRAVDIAKVTGLTKSRLHKYLVSLCRSNMLYQDPDTSLYFLSNKLTVLAAAVEKQNGIIAGINKALCQLRDRINISTGLTVKKNDNISLIHYNRSNRDVDIDYRENANLPLIQSAAGKVYLAFCEEYEGMNLLDPAEKEQIKECGYAMRLFQTEGIPGAKSIACPVFNQHNQLICVAVVMGFLPEDKLDTIARSLVETICELQLSVNPSVKLT